MNHYIIDGNNLIGKIKSINVLQQKDKQSSREKLVSLLNQYFAGRQLKVTLHFDGFPNTAVNLVKGRIVYSENQTADAKIRAEIDRSKNPKLIVLESSDNSFVNYGRVCSCKTIKAEEFYSEMKNKGTVLHEDKAIKYLEKEKDYFLDLFKNK